MVRYSNVGEKSVVPYKKWLIRRPPFFRRQKMTHLGNLSESIFLLLLFFGTKKMIKVRVIICSKKVNEIRIYRQPTKELCRHAPTPAAVVSNSQFP